MRFGRAPRCARCGGRLFDLRRERTRSLALRALRRSGGGEPLLPRIAAGYVRYFVPAFTVLSFLGAVVLGGTIGIGVLGALAALIVQLLAVGAVMTLAAALQGLLWLVRKVRGRTPIPKPESEALARVTLGPLPALGSGAEHWARGRVRVAAPILSPLGHVRCAAFRVVGEGPLGPVDDAGATTFEIISDEGVARVELGEATVDVAVTDPPKAVRPDAPLQRFLTERGLLLRPGPVRLAEAVLREGDEVEVAGTPASEVEADGYRAAQTVTVLRELPGTPLLVRKLEPKRNSGDR